MRGKNHYMRRPELLRPLSRIARFLWPHEFPVKNFHEVLRQCILYRGKNLDKVLYITNLFLSFHLPAIRFYPDPDTSILLCFSASLLALPSNLFFISNITNLLKLKSVGVFLLHETFQWIPLALKKKTKILIITHNATGSYERPLC